MLLPFRPVVLMDATLASLSSAQSEWALDNRVKAAREILNVLASDVWSRSGEWVLKELALEGYRPEGAAGATQASIKRMVLGSSVKTYLQTWLSARSMSTVLPSRHGAAGTDVTIHGPISLGAAAGGSHGELWCDAAAKCDVTPLQEDVAVLDSAKAVSVVLGAGNQSFLSLIDVLDRALAHGEAVMLKHHPLRPFLATPYAVLLEPLARRGVFAQVLDTGVAAATSLVTHPSVGHVVITGSENTFRSVRRALDQAGRAEVSITAELGCATPVLVVPGEWTDLELRKGAGLVAASKKGNAGCNCLAAQVVVLPAQWPQKGAFVAALKQELARFPDAPTYYPGAAERLASVSATYARRGTGGCTEVVAPPADTMADDALPCCHVQLLECGVAGEEGFEARALKEELFCPGLALVELPGGGADAQPLKYVAGTAAPFVNDEVMGSLSCILLAPALFGHTAVEQAISLLNYGSVCTNAPTFFGYTFMLNGGVWGAHATDAEMRSGTGVMGNHYGFSGVQKAVVFGPPLEKAMDLATLPPAIVFDAIHAATVLGDGPTSALLKVSSLLATRLLENCARVLTTPLVALGFRRLAWQRPRYGACA